MTSRPSGIHPLSDPSGRAAELRRFRKENRGGKGNFKSNPQNAKSNPNHNPKHF